MHAASPASRGKVQLSSRLKKLPHRNWQWPCSTPGMYAWSEITKQL
jgi:hypothetical protein